MTRLALPLVLIACQPAQEAPRVELPLLTDAAGIEAVVTDLGYEVTFTGARLVVRDFEFATAGELHATTAPSRFWDVIVRPAWAHPGHYEGGEVIGEARGRFVVDWLGAPGEELGTATLIVGTYTSVNFTFALGAEDDGLDADDALLGHTAHFTGAASKDDQEIAFDIRLDSPEDRVLVGVPFEAEIAADSEESIAFELLPEDELGGTLLDGVDFVALDVDDDDTVVLGPDATAEADVDAYNLVHRAFQAHNHYGFRALPPGEDQ